MWMKIVVRGASEHCGHDSFLINSTIFSETSRFSRHPVPSTHQSPVKSDTLIFVDSVAAGFQFEKSTVIVLHLQEGFKEVLNVVAIKGIHLHDYKFIVLMCGRGDLWSPDWDFRRDVAYCLNGIRDVNGEACIVLTATLPVLTDSFAVVNTREYRRGYLSQLAGVTQKIEFSRPGKFLRNVKGCIPDYYDEFNNLNDAGNEMIRRGLEAKFRCAGLRKRFN